MSPPIKEYGLITRKISGNAAAVPLTAFARASRLAAFAASSSDDNDDDNNADDASKSRTKPAASSKAQLSAAAAKVNLSMGVLQQRQIRKAQESAVADDPTIYQYDELYDDMQQQRQTAKVAQREAAQQADKRPKYIERLLVTAEARKKEHERRIERQVQKERDAEGAEFADKESFVTASYRSKLEEMRAAEEAEKRDEYLESIGDVTKQRDLGGFYRHLYEQRMGGGPSGTAEKLPAADVTEDMKKVTLSKDRTYRKRRASKDGDDDDEDDGAMKVASDAETPAEDVGEAADESNNKNKRTKKPLRAVKGQSHIQSNLDADSDFSIDSSSESEADDAKPKDSVEPQQSSSDQPSTKTESVAVSDIQTAQPTAVASKQDAPVDAVEPIPSAAPSSPQPKAVKIKVNIWLKRTVGDVLQAAIERYHERKRAREENY